MRKVNASNGGLTPAQLARRVDVTIETLRHYEDRSLLTPRCSPAGWRAFDAMQLERLDRIRAFRGMGFDLAQIAELLDAPAKQMAERLEKQADLLKRRIGVLNDSLEAVRGSQREARGEQDADKPGTDCTPAEKEGEACLVRTRENSAGRMGGRGATSVSARPQRRWPLAHRRAA